MTETKRERKKRIWEQELPGGFFIFLGVPPLTSTYKSVTVVAHSYGVTISFRRSDDSDHLSFQLEPALARRLGRQLLKKGDMSESIQVMNEICLRKD